MRATRCRSSPSTSTSLSWPRWSDGIVGRADARKGGRLAYPTEVMARVLVLKRLYNLPDEQMEYQLLDRMSYQCFCLLHHPHHSAGVGVGVGVGGCGDDDDGCVLQHQAAADVPAKGVGPFYKNATA